MKFWNLCLDSSSKAGLSTGRFFLASPPCGRFRFSPDNVRVLVFLICGLVLGLLRVISVPGGPHRLRAVSSTQRDSVLVVTRPRGQFDCPGCGINGRAWPNLQDRGTELFKPQTKTNLQRRTKELFAARGRHATI